MPLQNFCEVDRPVVESEARRSKHGSGRARTLKSGAKPLDSGRVVAR